MRARETEYKMGPMDVASYLIDLEKRWGVKVSVDFRMVTYGAGDQLLTMTIGVPFAVHQRELPFIPDITRLVTREVSKDMWGVAWGALYDFDLALGGHPDI